MCPKVVQTPRASPERQGHFPEALLHPLSPSWDDAPQNADEAAATSSWPAGLEGPPPPAVISRRAEVACARPHPSVVCGSP